MKKKYIGRDLKISESYDSEELSPARRNFFLILRPLTITHSISFFRRIFKYFARAKIYDIMRFLPTLLSKIISAAHNSSAKHSMQKQELLVITSYPPREKQQKENANGLSYHAKIALLAFKKASHNVSLTVLAEKFDESTQEYQESGIKVKRIWTRNSFNTFPLLLKEIFRNHKKTRQILFEFDFTLFGTMLHLLPLPIFLLFLRLLGKKITVVFHHVAGIEEHELYLKHRTRTNEGLLFFYYFYAHFIYRVTIALSTKAIVFEEALKDKLKIFGRTRKIVVIPNGVQAFKHAPDKKTARRRLAVSQGQFVVLFFGFLSWHKGTDWIVDAIGYLKTQKRHKNGKLRLIIAGGPNPAYMNDPQYRKYIENIERKCAENNVTLTGFVAEKDIPLYFQASDLVVFPYRTFIPSSPLSLAISFKKPFLLSESMLGLTKSHDISYIMEQLKITKEKMSFLLNTQFLKQVVYLQNNTEARKKLTDLSRHIAQARSWNILGRRYYEEIFG